MLCYYSSYSSSPSGLVIAFLVLLAVWGILNVILFFKLWGTCDNIKKMANGSPAWDTLYLAGKKEEAQAAAVAALVAELNAVYADQLKRISKDVRPSVSDFDVKSYNYVIGRWERRLAKVGGRLPDELRSGEAFVAWRLSVD